MASWSLSLRRSVSGPSVSALQSSVPLFRGDAPWKRHHGGGGGGGVSGFDTKLTASSSKGPKVAAFQPQRPSLGSFAHAFNCRAPPGRRASCPGERPSFHVEETGRPGDSMDWSTGGCWGARDDLHEASLDSVGRPGPGCQSPVIPEVRCDWRCRGHEIRCIPPRRIDSAQLLATSAGSCPAVWRVD